MGISTTIYNAINNDVIYNIDVIPSTGADEMTANGASIGNKGIELTIDYRAIDTEKIKWDSNYFASNKNTVLEMNGVTGAWLSQ